MDQNPLQRLKSLGSITTNFGQPNAVEQNHGGVDIANKIGTRVPAVSDGVVSNVETGHVQGERNLGNFVTLIDSLGNQQYYSHLHRAYVKPGDRVRGGQPIGEMGNTGSAYSKSGQGDGSHLDFRIVTAYGKYMNPMTYVKNITSQQ